MLICWLVIPHCDGSYYVYQHLVHPGLSMDPQVVMNRHFNESKKLYHSSENFLVAADRYIKENGAEALDKLLASKLRSRKPNVEVEEIKAPTESEKKGEQESTLMEADPQRNVAQVTDAFDLMAMVLKEKPLYWWKCEEPNVAQKEIPVVEVTEIKNVGNGAIRCEGPNAVKKEIKVTEVTKRTFSGRAQWLRSRKPNVDVEEIKAPAEPKKKGEQGSTLIEADPQRNVAHIADAFDSMAMVLKEKPLYWWKLEEPNVAQKEIPVVEVKEIKNVGDGAIKCEGPNAVNKEIKVMEVTQRTFSGRAQWVKQTEINLGETKSNTTCAAEIKERAAEIEACLHKKVQKEWACAVCQVTTQSKATLNSHLQGKRHKATSKQLKAKKQATKISGSPPVSMATKFDQSTKEEQLKCTSNNLKSKNNGISAASTVKNPDETRDDERQKCGSSNGSNEKNNKKQEEKALVLETSEQGHQNLKQNGDGMKELGSQCNICHVSCKSELDMTSHLNGRRHFNRIKQLSELWCSNCNVKCNSEADMASHRNGRRHLEQLMKWSGLWCSICSVSCNSKVNMNSHINGRRQLDQIKETVRIMMPRIVARAVACVVAHAGQSNLQ